jgi:hypothetical protein
MTKLLCYVQSWWPSRTSTPRPSSPAIRFKADHRARNDHAGYRFHGHHTGLRAPWSPEAEVADATHLAQRLCDQYQSLSLSIGDRINYSAVQNGYVVASAQWLGGWYDPLVFKEKGARILQILLRDCKSIHSCALLCPFFHFQRRFRSHAVAETNSSGDAGPDGPNATWNDDWWHRHNRAYRMGDHSLFSIVVTSSDLQVACSVRYAPGLCMHVRQLMAHATTNAEKGMLGNIITHLRLSHARGELLRRAVTPGQVIEVYLAH